MTDSNPLSKEAQLARSAGQSRTCPTTGLYKGKCSCPPCRGRRSRGKGQRKQRETRKVLALRPERWSGRTGNEETWNASSLRFEVKAGKQVQPIATRYLAARKQSDAARAVGDLRPFCFVACPDGSGPLVVIRADELAAVLAAFAEEWSAE